MGGLITIGILLPFLLLILPGVLFYRKVQSEKNINLSEDTDDIVVSVWIVGGFLGMGGGSPLITLRKYINEYNQKGYETVQVIGSSSGNLFLRIGQISLLVCTFFFFTYSSGYYVIMTKKRDRTISGNKKDIKPKTSKELLTAPEKDTSLDFLEDKNCTSCGSKILESSKFCENCGKKVLGY